jgi:hypothetical protein
MNRARAAGLVLTTGLAVGALGAVLGDAGLWALILLTALLAGLAEIGGG